MNAIRASASLNGPGFSLEALQGQRDRALACLILSLFISLAVFVSVFSKNNVRGIEEARQAVAIHETLLKDSETDVEHLQNALRAVRAALEKLPRASST